MVLSRVEPGLALGEVEGGCDGDFHRSLQPLVRPPFDQQASHRHAVPDRPRGFPTADPGSDFLAASHSGWGDEPVTRWGMGR